MKYDVFGLGNVLVDVSIKVGDKELEELGLKKGRFHLLDKESSKKLIKGINKKGIMICPAGSCANTLFGVAELGGRVIFSGKIGKDNYGRIYEKSSNNNFKCRFAKCEIDKTGRVYCFITSDAERTFAVDLGAANNLKKEEISEEDIKNSKIIHLTGYEFENIKESWLHAIEIAKKNKVLITIDLSDPGVVERNLDGLKKILKEYADIIFLNEGEAKAFAGKEAEEAISELGEYADIAIIKLGAKGSLINDNGAITFIEGVRAKAVDTTGAGDLYAAGILYGISKGYDLERAGKLASALAARVVEQLGARPVFDLKKIRDSI